MRTWMAILATAAATAGLMKLTEADAQDDTISTHQIILLDSNGVARGVIGINPIRNEAGIVFVSADSMRGTALAETGVYIYDNATTNNVPENKTVGLHSNGLFLSYPGPGTYESREAASLSTDSYSSEQYVGLRLGSRGPTASYRNAASQGWSLSAGRPVAGNPSPGVAAYLNDGGVTRVSMTDLPKALRVFSSSGHVRFQK